MIDPEAVLNCHRKPVPRYTSYPTAPMFKAGLGTSVFKQSLSGLEPAELVSAYLHIPFCDRLCWFCACHTKHTLKYAPVARYVKSLVGEIELLGQNLQFRPHLGQLHLGGGSPSLLERDDLLRIRQALDQVFQISDKTEISVEIDPSDVDESTIGGLAEFGLTRASIGVQDFHEDVQAAINRPQGFEITRDVVHQLRRAGIHSVNIDALYGLPLQSENRLLRTLEQCVTLQPDRMALFGYAHVPWLKKHQNMIKSEDLAGPLERYNHSRSASQALVVAGYEAIGIDHFAKPADSLARAAHSGRLHRNFQGYTTDHHQTLIGCGASAIGRSRVGYVQNTVPTNQYETQISQAVTPKNRGLILTEDDRLRSHLIERLMCDFAVNFDALDAFPPQLVDICRKQARRLVDEDQFGLCSMENETLLVQTEARSFTRIIASRFDAYYEPEHFQYSKAV
jgi:oxygen-independent coproporphyrinogen-3 oxidase